MALYRLTHLSLASFSRGYWQTVQNQILKINDSHNIKPKKLYYKLQASFNAYNVQFAHDMITRELHKITLFYFCNNLLFDSSKSSDKWMIIKGVLINKLALSLLAATFLSADNLCKQFETDQD